MERVGWKTEETGRPCNLNGILWLCFLETWCIKIALDSRTKQVKKINGENWSQMNLYNIHSTKFLFERNNSALKFQNK